MRPLVLLLAGVAAWATATPVAAQVPAACLAFTDPSLASGVRVKAAHINELRACVDARRVQVGLPGANWTNTPVVSGVTRIRAIHLLELRSAMAEAFAAAAQPAPSYTDPTITAGVTRIKWPHVAELRAAAWALVPPGQTSQAGDTDGDGTADLTYWHPSDGTWQTLTSLSDYTAASTRVLGTSADVPVAGDYDGDGRLDPATWNPTTGYWTWLRSSTGYAAAPPVKWGERADGDIPAPADYDGDGKTDLATWRQTDGFWYILKSSSGNQSGMAFQWGTPGGARPVPADFDGDGTADLAVWEVNTGLWRWLRSDSGFATEQAVTWGSASLGDVPVPADYDGDGKADPATWRGPTGAWALLFSATNFTTSDTALTLGQSTLEQQPVPADYDGDGLADRAIWGARDSSDGGWFIQASGSGLLPRIAWGLGADWPISAAPPAPPPPPPPGACPSAVTPNPVSTGKEGGEMHLTVTTPAGCAWQAETAEGDWTILGASTGVGAGSVSYSYTENTDVGPRSVTLTIAGVDVEVTQDGTNGGNGEPPSGGGGGSACTFTVTPPSSTVSSYPATLSLAISTGESCEWSAPLAPGFLTLSSGSASGGTGNGSVVYDAPANTGAARQIAFHVAGRTITVAQEGMPDGGCVFSLSATVNPVAASGGGGAITIGTQPACEWSVSSDAAWLTLQGTDGEGSGAMSYGATANSGTDVRVATVIVGQQVIQITQGAMPQGITILINGSFDPNPPWFQDGAPELNAIAGTFGYNPIRWPWTDNDNVFGNPLNPYPAIYNGAVALANYLNGLELAPGGHLNVITHSHGGNVALAASWLMNPSYRHLINLATPVNFDLPPLKSGKAYSHCQVYSMIDLIQFLGASPGQVALFSMHEGQAAYHFFQAGQALFDEDYALAGFHSSEGAWHQAQAFFWWMTTRHEQHATNMAFGGGWHDDMHEPPVWHQIKNQCALN